ncbi:hypothetical protein [Flavobacterium columnare]|uniref:Uncharacterized protein n=1 Tax=Flavobacterium columnare TaxID=996 RepID=A0AA94JNB2_9FLAO|nr:hypothetical protein [Flavobacterium columnare]MCH4828958.1 hypothetical protein [Flavobacterium columnare]MCH4831720.1 hypothetical protein [Flavobacterium columnare]
MKQSIFNLILSLSMINCKGQEIKNTININTLKKDTMEYFSEEKYKDWKLDKENSFTTDKRYIKENIWVRIIISNEGYREEIEQLNSPYETIKIYHKNLSLRINGSNFYGFSVGIDKEYDENGKLIKETDNDKNYPFKVEDLCKLIKEEYDVDLMIKPNPNKEELQYRVSRSYDPSTLKHLYLVSFTYGNSDIELGDKILPPIKVVYIDGSNGKILFEESRSLNLPNGDKIPHSKTKFLQKGEKEKKGSEVYKIHQGKSYTQSEWEEFEEKQYEEYCRKTGRAYTPKDEVTKREDTIKKNSFIADDLEKGDKHAPKKKKGFWNNLFK